MRIVRVYHAGRDGAHRARERALVALGVELRLIVPRSWPERDNGIEGDTFEIVELDVQRPGDVNRHTYADGSALRRAIEGFAPDIVDVHEEPFSLVTRQVLRCTDRPIVMYTAQNLDKRWPPPFLGIRREAYSRVRAFYPCSRQAASVLRGSGYAGTIVPLPLGIDTTVHYPGTQSLTDGVVLGFVGRLVPEKGLLDAITVAAEVGALLLVAGSGPQEAEGRELATRVGARVEWHPWVDAMALAGLYRRMHVVLVPSRATTTWVEQFGRVITEGWANGVVPVGFGSGSIPEVVGDAGRTVTEGDVSALVDAARTASSDPTWSALRSAGIARAGGLFWEAVAVAQAALYVDSAAPPAANTVGRVAARQEWGPTASTSLSTRPFALPVLRDSRPLHQLADRFLS